LVIRGGVKGKEKGGSKAESSLIKKFQGACSLKSLVAENSEGGEEVERTTLEEKRKRKAKIIDNRRIRHYEKVDWEEGQDGGEIEGECFETRVIRGRGGS